MKTLALLAALTFAGAAAAAAAPGDVLVEAGTVPTARVSYADINLGSDAGLRTLEGRIRAAASNLCLEDGTKPLDEQLNRRACYDAAVAGGLAQLDDVLADRTGGTAFAASSLTIRAH